MPPRALTLLFRFPVFARRLHGQGCLVVCWRLLLLVVMGAALVLIKAPSLLFRLPV